MTTLAPVDSLFHWTPCLSPCMRCGHPIQEWDGLCDDCDDLERCHVDVVLELAEYARILHGVSPMPAPKGLWVDHAIAASKSGVDFSRDD
jgi:hypothetical protein